MKKVKWFLCCLALLLTACAGDPGASYGADLTTPSDESEARKLARLRVELATGYFENGQTAIALDELKQALNADPTYIHAYNLRGLVYMRLSNNELAQDSFRRALSLNPQDPDVLHNYAWLLCQSARYSESFPLFAQAIANPTYSGQAKSWMTLGVCQANAGDLALAEKSLMHAYELDAANPVTAYNLADVLYKRRDFKRAQFYIRRLNHTELANAQSLWLGIQVERSLGDVRAQRQLGDQLKKRYAHSVQATAYERGAFND